MIFFSSDHHFGHFNIIGYCNRPFKNIDHMNESLVEYWNETVSPNDVVYYLGDLAMNQYKAKQYITRCNGRKILISGNHDKCWKGQDKWIDFYKNECGFIEVFPRGVFPRAIIRWDNGIDFTGLHIRLSHLPYDAHDERYHEYMPVEDGTGIDMLLHGHRHSTPDKAMTVAKNGIWCYDVGVDCNNYRPVSETEIINKFVSYKRAEHGIID